MKRNILLDLITRLRADGCTGLAGMIAYNFFLAVPTLLIFIVTFLAFLPIDNAVVQIREQLTDVLPADALTVLIRVMENTIDRGRGSVPVLVFSLLGALYVMNNGYAGLISSINRIYDLEEKRSWLRVRLRALVLSVVASIFLMSAFLLVLAVPPILDALADDPGTYDTLAVLVQRLRLPVILVLAAIGIESTYRFAPSEPHKWRIVSPGTIVAAAAWMLATLGFGYYVNNFSAYEDVYGGLGAVIVLLTWMWISAMMFLTGAEINMMWLERTGEATRDTNTLSASPD